jgi:hypothetical protein
MSRAEQISPARGDSFISKMTGTDVVRIICYTALFSLYTGGLLALTDFSLAKFLPDYRYSGKFIRGMSIFFVASSIFIIFCRWQRWSNWRFFVLGSLAVFFPLVFIASTLTLFIGGENSLSFWYSTQYCAADTQGVCGEGFAAAVFSMSLRALPTVLTAPALFWYVLLYRPQLQTGNRS